MSALTAAVDELRRLYPEPAHPKTPLQAIGAMPLGTAVLAVFFWLAERWWPEDPEQPRWRSESRTDAAYWFFDFFITQRFAGAIVFIVLAMAVMLRIPHRVTTITALPIGLQALLALLVSDFCGYWAHRWAHTRAFLWRFHAVHHSSRMLDWLAAARVHPIYTVWTRLAGTLPLFLCGFASPVLASFPPFLAFYPIYLHSNLSWGYGWFGYVLASPAFHRWHHTAEEEGLDKNFAGLLPLWDFLFGTAYFPRNRRSQVYGLHSTPMPTGFWRQLAQPFRRS